MEGTLTQTLDPNIALQTVTSRQVYLAFKLAEKFAKQPKAVKPNLKVYNNYSDRKRERCADRKRR